jgi:hypothetical protein
MERFTTFLARRPPVLEVVLWCPARPKTQAKTLLVRVEANRRNPGRSRSKIPQLRADRPAAPPGSARKGVVLDIAPYLDDRG